MSWMRGTKYNVYCYTSGATGLVELHQNGQSVQLNPLAIRRFVEQAIQRGYVPKWRIKRALKAKKRLQKRRA